MYTGYEKYTLLLWKQATKHDDGDGRTQGQVQEHRHVVGVSILGRTILYTTTTTTTTTSAT